MEPLIALVGVTLALRTAGAAGVRRLRPWPVALRGGLATMFTMTGMAHFIGLRAQLISMVPPAACWTLNGPARAVSLRAQPLRGSHSHLARRILNRSPALRRSPGHGPAGALSILLTSVVGFTHRSLRAQVTCLLGIPYSASQMSYDLTRLRRKGLIQRLPGTNTYVLTPDGARFALFYTKLHDRLPVPLLAADRPPAPPALRDALAVIDHSIDDYLRSARLEAA